MYQLLQTDFRYLQFHFYRLSYCQILTPLLLFEKVTPAIQETSRSCHIIHAIIFHFTDGEGYRSIFANVCSTIVPAVHIQIIP